jgi:hypothetical protein
VDIPATRILYQGARSMSDLARVQAALGNLDRSLTFSGDPDFPVEPEDLGILQLAKAPVTIRRLAWGQKALDPDRLRAVYGLLIAGALRDPADMAAIRHEVRDEMTRSETLDNVRWLGVPSNAAPAEIVGALEKRQARYQALLAAVAGDVELKTDVELLAGRVSMALRLARRAR